MDLVLLVLMLCLIGFAVYMLTTKIPMPDYWKIAIQVFVLIVIVLFLARKFNLPNLL